MSIINNTSNIYITWYVHGTNVYTHTHKYIYINIYIYIYTITSSQWYLDSHIAQNSKARVHIYGFGSKAVFFNISFFDFQHAHVTFFDLVFLKSHFK